MYESIQGTKLARIRGQRDCGKAAVLDMRGTVSHEHMAAIVSCKIAGQDQAPNIPAWIVGGTGGAIPAETY